MDGWHIGAICEHLEAVTSGQILRLLMNVPPRTTKSILTSVMWGPWEWLRKPELRYLHSSYAQALSTRDSVKARRVIQSPRYQELLQAYQPDFVLIGDQNTKTRYDNSYNGYRIATSVGGVGTGEGGDRLVVDDIHNVMEAESIVKRLFALSWWDEAMSSRLDDWETGAKVAIMQRTHQHDLTGHILKQMAELQEMIEEGYNDEDEEDNIEWTHLCLPMRYEPKTIMTFTPLDFEDPREEEGELLCPDRFSEKAVKDLERSLGKYATACQLQQRPAPREGGLIPVEGFRFTKTLHRLHIDDTVRYWDKAGTEDGGKRTSGCLIHKMQNGSFIIEDVTKGQWSSGKRELVIENKAEEDRERASEVEPSKWVDPKIWTEQEPGSGGKESAENTIKNLAGYPVHADKVTGSKEVRAEPFAAQVEGHNVFLLLGTWNDDFIEECQMFPNGTFSDQVDSASGAFNKLNSKKKTGGVWGNRDRVKRTRRKRKGSTMIKRGGSW